MKTPKNSYSKLAKRVLARPVIVHRILPVIKEYGSGKKSYHIIMQKQFRRHDIFYHNSNDKQREYSIEV